MTLEWADASAHEEATPRARDEDASTPLAGVSAGLLPLAAGVMGFGVYAATLAPTVSILDSPELSAAAITLGVPHPTGYPLFTLVGHAFQAGLGAVAGGDPAWRLNGLTAVFAAVAVGTLAAVGRRVTGRASAGWMAALVFGFSPAFWAQANVVEVYALHVAFASAILALWLRVETAAETGARLRPALRWLAFATGLSFTHHLMTVLLLPVVLVSVAKHVRAWWSPREALVLCGLGLAPLVLYGALPLIAARDPLVNWGNPQTLEALWLHVSGAQYHHNVEAPSDGWWTTLARHGGLVAGQLGWWLAPLAILGALRTPATATVRAALALGFVTAFGFAFSYGVVDDEPFHLNAMLIASLWIGGGAAWAVAWTGRRSASLGRATEALVWLAPAFALFSTFPDLDRRDEFAPHDQAVAALAMLPESAVLVTQGPEGYPPVYAQLVENLRPDVAVVDTYLHVRGSYGPELDRLRQSRLPQHVTPEMALLETVAGLDGGTRSLWLMPGVPDLGYEKLGLHRVRGGILDPLLRGRPDLRAEPPADPHIDFPRGFSLRGVRTDAASVESGAALRITAWWQLGEIAGGDDAPSVTFVLADAEGAAPTGRDDLPLFEHKRWLGGGVPLARYAKGDVIRDDASVLVPRSIEPGRWWLWVGLRAGGEWLELPDGRLFARTARVEVRARSRGLWTLPR